jgi:hypothetical protein
MRKNRRPAFKNLIENLSIQAKPPARPVVDLLPRGDAVNLWRSQPRALPSGTGGDDQTA